MIRVVTVPSVTSAPLLVPTGSEVVDQVGQVGAAQTRLCTALTHPIR